MKKLALFAGRGTLPEKIIALYEEKAWPFVIFAFEDQTPVSLLQNRAHVWVRFGAVNEIFAQLKHHDVQEIVMAGGMHRPTLRQLRPDARGMKMLARIGLKSFGDDSLLKLVIQELESEGYCVRAPHDILQDLVMRQGCLTHRQPAETSLKDMGLGFDVLAALGPYDVGQSVIVQQGVILGIEGVEGTDALIKRCAPWAKEGGQAVLVKASKPGQEKRADMPTIGPKTIQSAAEAGLIGIAGQSDYVMMLDEQKCVDLSNQHGVFVIGHGPLS